ncbi:flagellar hook-length control protein FliK [Sphaerotilus mobilis]|uniref:Flagellar hook-length control protein FliK n=1 Tax=Sphaerotilus mobilis TaxID=47994 RepID=A0A4Q7LAR4_9BURK|nr:flagellar hook-length control protein FliK [Sphaerotilus mobilis]RZS47598.1 flagellar hook-length control protein FliK [Sphaerotilus mobilis]
MSSPSLSALSAETARLDRQAASRSGRDEGTPSGGFSALLTQAQQGRAGEADARAATLQRQLQERAAAAPKPASAPAPATRPATPSNPSMNASTNASTNTAAQAARTQEQRQTEQRRAEASRGERARDVADDEDGAPVDEPAAEPTRSDPSAASGATPTWLMHTVVRSTMRGGAAGQSSADTTSGAAGGTAGASAAPIGPGSGGTGERAGPLAAGGWAGGTGLGGLGGQPGQTGPAELKAGRSGPDGPADAAGLSGVKPGAPGNAEAAAAGRDAAGAISLGEAFQAVPGPESFAGQLAALATAQAAPTAASNTGSGPIGHPVEAQIDTPLDAPGFGEAVMHTVARLAGDGAQEIKLHLNPVEMGPIQIRIAIESGQARIEFGAAAEATRQALEQAMPALAESLQADGLNLAAGSGVAPTTDPTLAGQASGNLSAWSGGSGQPGQGQPGPGQRGLSDGRSPVAGNAHSAATGVAAPVGHELRTGWAGTTRPGNGALRALDLYA